MSVRQGLERTLPGRLVGVSVDADGAPALRLALQTREQHIRREKATSNICTAQVLLAVMASMYAVYHGREGLELIARRVHRMAAILAEGIRRGGLDDRARPVLRHDPGEGAVPRRRGAGRRPAARREPAPGRRRHRRDRLRRGHRAAADRGGLGGVPASGPRSTSSTRPRTTRSPAALLRTSDFLTHPVFSQHRSETQMLRYLRKLSGRDVALDRSMIPLGSCTMKLNATTEMQAVTWPEFATIHPFAPLDQADGYLRLINDLERWLIAITGYDAVSLQPNAGSQGEFAGLLAIRGYHRSRGDDDRDVCLIPSSAHGTNAASAVMCGMRVVVVATDDARQRRHGRPGGEDRRARRPPRGADDHLPVDVRRLRGDGQRHLRDGAPGRRAGVRRRREHERAGRPRAARQVRRRRLAPEPAQDVLHPARRRRPGHRPGRRPRAPAAVPAEPPAAAGGRSRVGPRPGVRGAVGLGRDPADLVGVHPPDGARRPAAGDAGGAAERELHREAAAPTTTRSCTRAGTTGSRTSASSTCARSRRRPASPSTTWRSG